jgi:hypothetical protein
MTNDCKLSTWTHNSRIDHAVSSTGAEGPYDFAVVSSPVVSGEIAQAQEMLNAHLHIEHS